MKNSFIPNAVNNLMQDAITGRSSRRQLIQRGSALGLSSALMGVILRAENVGAQASPEASPAAAKPAGWSITTPGWLEGMDLSGKTVNTVLSADGPGAPFDQACCDYFAKVTGAKVNYIKGAESTTDRLTNYTNVLNSQSSDFDVFTVDVIWPGILKIHSVDLKDVADQVEQDGGTFFERILTNNTIDDMTVSLPMYTDAGVFYTRTDLLDKYSLTAPKTWADMEKAAQTILDGEKGANPSFTGFVWQGAAYEGLTCDGLEWIYSNGGGTIVDEDANVTVGNDQSKAAIERAVKWVGGISPSAVTNYKENDGLGVWTSGNAAFLRNWPYVYAESQKEGSVVKDKFSLTLLPMGDGDGATNAACLGGWNMMVSKYSPDQDTAKQFARFMVSPEVQKARAIERSLNATIEETYQDQDVLAANPYMKDLFDVFKEGSIARPSGVAADLYNDVSTAFFTTVNNLLSGQSSDVSGSMDDLASQIEDILADL